MKKLVAASTVALMFAAFAGAQEQRPAAPAKKPAAPAAKPPAKPAAAPAAKPTETAAAPASAATEGAKAADKKWLVDDKTGQRYSIESIPKVEGSYRWLDSSRVRFPGGAIFEIIEHDDQQFMVKAYEIPERAARNPEKRAAKAPVDKEATAAAYKYGAADVDRIQLARFDEGLPQRGQWRNGFDMADMDKDGNLDIVFGPARKGRANPNIFLSNGQGAWKRAEQKYPPQPYDYGDVAVGDFNGDGAPDLVFGIHLRGLLVLVADGEGGYKPWTEGIEIDIPGQNQGATAFSSRAVGVVDWNQDGKLDVIATGEGPKGLKSSPTDKDKGLQASSRGIRVYLNQGDGTWKAIDGMDTQGQRPNFTDTFALGDFNRDGRLDVFHGTRQIGNGNLLGLRRETGELEFHAVPEIRPRALVLSTVAHDLDKDGWLDVLVGYQSNEGIWRSGVDVLWGGKEGFRRQPLFNRENRAGFNGLDVGDVDGDGHADVVAVSQDSEFWIMLGDGKRKFSAEQSAGELPTIRSGCAAAQVTLEDLNGDKRDEIVVAFAGEPTGYPGLEDLNVPGCPEQGSINVWTPSKK
jgi:hypothetical protein